MFGRIIMGIGKSGEPVDSKKLRIKLGEFVVAENGVDMHEQGQEVI